MSNLSGLLIAGGSNAQSTNKVLNNVINGSASSSDYSGLSISDLFGDEIRDLQQQAAEQQMAYQTQSAERAMQFSAEEAKKNRDWQEYMSNTAYSRAVQDMKTAGLNPILAASGSSMSASTPSGSSAQGFAQSGSQAAVSDKNSGLDALATYISAITSALNAMTSLGSSKAILSLLGAV